MYFYFQAKSIVLCKGRYTMVVSKNTLFGPFFVELFWRLSTAAGTAGGGLFYFCYNQR